MIRTIDLNADVGEGHPDAPLFELITSANIACGGHAGDEATIDACVREATSRAVRIGAHPGYEDRAGMGRTSVALTPEALEALVLRQVERVASAAARRGASVSHVKPHGALYHDAGRAPALAAAFSRAVKALAPQATVVGAPGSALLLEAEALGLRAAAEGFADRRYQSDGTLVPRSLPGALLEDPELAAAQAVALACDQRVASSEGGWITVPAQTICIHGDTPGALAIARRVHRRLQEAGVRIAPPP